MTETLLPASGQTRALLIDGPAGVVDALLSAPREPAPVPAVALICHPHPLHGGEMSNKVTYTLASCAQKAGCYALRFNFRGAGRSAGEHDFGRGETVDTVFLARWLQDQLPGSRLLLAGFSFGAWVSANAAAQLAPVGVISIAPPFAKYFGEAPLPQRPDCPWLVVHDGEDEVVDYTETIALLQRYAPPPEIVSTRGAGHFFHGRLTELSGIVQPFFSRALAGG